MYKVSFLASNEEELKAQRRDFGLLQDLLRRGFNPRNADELGVFADIRAKLREVSEENGTVCTWCGSIQRATATSTFNRLLRTDGAEICFENDEHRLIVEAMKSADKKGMFDVIEEVHGLIKRFETAPKA